MKLFGQDPATAQKWREINSDEQGRRFYRKYQGRIKNILDSYELAQAYDRVSGASPLARGFKISQREQGHRSIQSYRINVQEFDPEHPHYLIGELLFTLRVQAQLFANLPDAAPEIADPLLLETRIPQFQARVTRVGEALRRWYVELLNQAGQTAEPPS
jgi:hypothetical protein